MNNYAFDGVPNFIWEHFAQNLTVVFPGLFSLVNRVESICEHEMVALWHSVNCVVDVTTPENDGARTGPWGTSNHNQRIRIDFISLLTSSKIFTTCAWFVYVVFILWIVLLHSFEFKIF